MYQSSVRQVPLPAPTSMQITASPELNNTTAHRQIKESLNAVATDTSSTKRNASRAHLNGIRKKMKKTFDPEKVIFTFLRDHCVSINVNTANLKFVNKKGGYVWKLASGEREVVQTVPHKGHRSHFESRSKRDEPKHSPVVIGRLYDAESG